MHFTQDKNYFQRDHGDRNLKAKPKRNQNNSKCKY